MMALDLTQAFYIDRGEDFARSRHFFMRGWHGFLSHLPQRPVKILDIGCGQGRFGEYLLEQQIDFDWYVGIDYSPTLLKIARKKLPKDRSELIEGDIRDEGIWDAISEDFDLVVALNMMHHIDSFDKRVELLEKMQQRLVAGGVGMVSFWQMHKRAKLLAKATRVTGKQDYLLPFGEEEKPVRFVHSFDDPEICLMQKRVMMFGNVVEWCGIRADKDNRYLLWSAEE